MAGRKYSGEKGIKRPFKALKKQTFEQVLLLILIISIFLFTAPACAAEDGDILIVGLNKDFPPFDYTDSSGKPTGFVADIIEAVAEEMGLNITYQSGSWNDIRNELEAGNIDLIAGMYYSEERDETLNFSKTYLPVSHAIFVKEDSSIDDISDLSGLEIVVQEGDIMHDYLLKREENYTIIPVTDQIDAISLISEGNHDAALIAKLHGSYLIEQNHIQGIKTTGQPLETRQYSVAASPKGSHYLPAINEGLAIIKANGRYDEIYDKWFGVYEEKEFFAILTDIVLFVLLPVIILLAAALAWSLKLRKSLIKTSGDLENELKVQKMMRTALKDSKDKYLVLFNSISDIVCLSEYSHDIRSEKIIEINDTACSDLGYTRSELLEMTSAGIISLPDSQRKEYIRILENAEEVSYRSSMKRKDGTKFPVQIKSKLLIYDDNKYLLRLIRDITDEVETHIRENEALKQIEQNLAQLAILNDEIRNPLAVIVGVADMEIENSTAIILEQAKIIDRMIDKLDRGWLESAKIREFLKKHLEMANESED